MGSFCGSSPQTVVTSASNPNVTAQQNQIYGLVNQYATDFGQNPSQLVAPWNQLQTSAAQGVSDNVNSNQPWDYLGEGAIGQGTSTASYAPSLYAQGAQTVSGVNPISSTPWNPTQYESPYTQDVINATTANINQQNQIAQNGALGNAIQSGNAFGGDRAGVMMGNLANQQALAENQTIASLQQADFNQASQQANAQQQYNLNLGLGNNSQLMQQAGVYGQLGSGLTNAGLGLGNLGYQTGNLGNLGQQSTLGALQGLYNMGTGLQGTQQQQLSAPLTFGQWYGNASPGTSSVPTSTTYPGSNPLSTITGLGLTGIGAASMLSNLLPAAAAVVSTGGRVNKDSGGGVGEEDDLVGRYHRMTQAMHRMHRDMGGGAQQPGQQPQQATSMGQINPLAAGTMAMIGNVPQSRQMPTTEAAQLQRNFRLMRNVSNPQEPGTAQAAIQQLETQQASTGGAIHKDDGGGMGMDPAASSIGDLSPDLKMKAFERAMKLAHRGLDFLSQPQQSTASSPTLDLPPTGTQRPPGPLLGAPSGGSGSPTQAPSASANSLSQLGTPSGMMGLLKLVDSTKKKPPTQAPTVPSTPVPGTADSASPVYGPGSDTGGADMGAADLGSGADFARGGVPHFDDGGPSDPDPGAYNDAEYTPQAHDPVLDKLRQWYDVKPTQDLPPYQEPMESPRDVRLGGLSEFGQRLSAEPPQAPEEPQASAEPQALLAPGQAFDSDQPGNQPGLPIITTSPPLYAHPGTRSSSYNSSEGAPHPAASAPAGPPNYANELARMQMQYLRQAMSPGNTLFNMGVGMLSHAGERDAHGLPISGAAQIGRGASDALDRRQALLGGIQNQQKMALEAAKTPAEIEEINARAALARTNADKPFLLEIERQKAQMQNEALIRKQQMEFDFMRQMQEGASGPLGKGTPARYKLYNWGQGQLTPEE